MLKSFSHSAGLSCTFRQWRDTSHCSQLHCYHLALEIEYEGDWTYRHDQFIQRFHKCLLIAEDDPQFDIIAGLSRHFFNTEVLPAIGCERFAQYIAKSLSTMQLSVDSVTVREHEGNFATYFKDGTFQAGKKYPFSLGLSCIWKEGGQIKGGPLAVTPTFKSTTLNDNNWVLGFGGLKPVRSWLEKQFDHTTLINMRDADLSYLGLLAQSDINVANILLVEEASLEGFAQLIYSFVSIWVRQQYTLPEYANMPILHKVRVETQDKAYVEYTG